jgi:hypothetical protein
MTTAELHNKLFEIEIGLIKAKDALPAVEEWAKSQYDGKPIVSGALPLAEIFDMLNKAHEELAKCSLSQDEYSPISWALVDAKKRLSVLLRQ